MTFTALKFQYTSGGSLVSVTFRNDEVARVRVVENQQVVINYLTNGSPRLTYIGSAKKKVICQIRKKDSTHAALLALIAIQGLMRMQIYRGSTTIDHDLWVKINPNTVFDLHGGSKTWEPVELTFYETTSGDVSVADLGSS